MQNYIEGSSLDELSDYMRERDRLRAVNAELVAALERAEKCVRNYNPKFPMGDGYYAEFVAAMESVHAALAKAKGE